MTQMHSVNFWGKSERGYRIMAWALLKFISLITINLSKIRAILTFISHAFVGYRLKNISV